MTFFAIANFTRVGHLKVCQRTEQKSTHSHLQKLVLTVSPEIGGKSFLLGVIFIPSFGRRASNPPLTDSLPAVAGTQNSEEAVNSTYRVRS